MNDQTVIYGSSFEKLNNYVSDFSSITILADSNTSKFCVPVLFEKIPSLINSEVIINSAGEESKSLDSVSKIAGRLLLVNADRKCLLINVGGGMITDLGGFTASVYKRGIKFINIPTSLLAMVDASIGGKTGVNLNGIKNVIGTFSLPEFVIIDESFLKTLPEREKKSAFAEIIKHILLSSPELWNELIQDEKIFFSDEKTMSLVRHSISFKQEVVKNDFKETGRRYILNFGHTLGHAFESASMKTDYKLLHGEAIAAGLIGELYFSTKLTGLDHSVLAAAIRVMTSIYPDLQLNQKVEELFSFLRADKKNKGSSISFSLLNSPGNPSDLIRVNEELISEAIQFTIDAFINKNHLVNDKH